MTNYSPPLRSLKFVLDEVVGLESILSTDKFDGIDADTVHMVLEEIGRFMTEVIAPTNVDGDQITTKWSEGGVVTAPESFTKAYKQFVDAGYGAIPFDPTYGGGGFPWVTALAIQEMMTSGNMAFALCPLLTQGAIDAIEHHGSEEQQATYLPKMLTGEWSGTMNLSEPQAGSDVGAVVTKAEPVGDGSYRIKGQKIWITWGEHDMSDNIIHLVLARTPGAPPGTKGITMFLVPKFLLDADGNPGERNDVSCVSIEHKLGIHGSPTCVLSFGDNEGAIGWPVGDEFTGMRNMFTMMNNARLSVGLQGLSVAERSYQMGLDYAQERLQGTAVGAERGVQSPIIEHADVRRMLMTQRSWIDAMRILLYTNGAAIDLARSAEDPAAREAARERADLLIPISKSLCTDLGVELTSITIQIYGGMGFVEETGAAQFWRDSRIAPIYEGTNGIQAADLVGRKLPMRGGAVLEELLAEFDTAADELANVDGMADAAAALRQGLATARDAAAWLLENGPSDPNAMLAGSTPFLRLLGTVVCGGFMAQQAVVAAAATDDADGFYAARLAASAFFETQILPTVEGLLPSVKAGPSQLFALSPKQFA
ncbi:MAG: acyl-CoA dehydrogenase [Acidimicrobiales bacterium]